jgi:DnaJ-class molecular chaperone
MDNIAKQEVECEECEGSGHYYWYDENSSPQLGTCEECEGSGTRLETNEEARERVEQENLSKA